jgi:excinuclease ABC subunit C
MNILAQKLKNLPESSGVYLMLDENGKVIYVGKARVLKNRVRQYFHSPQSLNDKTMAMVSKVADFTYIITPTEADALALEANLIKKHKPPYNILLKDDKHFPYIAVNLKEDYPTFRITRKVKNDGSKYFGPFMGVRAADLLDIISEAFPVKLCKLNPAKVSKSHRPCLNYHIGKCLGPCKGFISREEYREIVRRAADFLNGDDEGMRKALIGKMNRLSQSQQYEAALIVRDRLRLLDKIKASKVAAMPEKVSYDVFSYHTDGKYGAVSMLVIRDGNMEGARSFSVSDAGLYPEDTLTSFLTQYYGERNAAPAEILVGIGVDCASLEEFVYKLHGRKVKVTVPQRGKKRKLAEMARKNAEEYLYKYLESIKYKEELTRGAVSQLAEVLSLRKLPHKMECYDISHISGTDKTASMAVFVNGEKQPALYRRFRVKVEGNDDYASMEEIIKRRLGRYLEGDEDYSFGSLPDLIVIDGGAGQLKRAARAAEELGVDVEMVSLAEREEEIYTLQSPQPIALPRSSLSLRLLQRIRDEAHRFALSYHRKLREKRIASELDAIKGIGEKRKAALIAKFGTLENIKNATIEQLCEVRGITRTVAKNILEYFANKEKE